MRDFKFFSDNIQYEYIPIPEDCATWVWDTQEIKDSLTQGRVEYEIVQGIFRGILDFLNTFPPGFVVVVHSIMGVESNRYHDANTEREGWGFNIQTDELLISFYRILPEQN